MIDEFPVKNMPSILWGSNDRELCQGQWQQPETEYQQKKNKKQWADDGGVIQG